MEENEAIDVTGAIDPAAGDQVPEVDLESIDALPEGHTVPVSVLRKIREDAKAKVEAEREAARVKDDQLMLMRAYMQAQQQGQAPQQGAQDYSNPIAGFFRDRDPDEPITIGEIQRLANLSQKVTDSQMRLVRAQQDPDFKDLVSEHIANVLRSKPELAGVIKSLPTEPERWLLAYELAKTDPEYHKKKLLSVPESEEAKRIKENATKTKSPAAVAPASVASTEADRIKNMSSAEFRAYRAQRVAAGRK